MSLSNDATLWLQQLDQAGHRDQAAGQIVQAYVESLLRLINANLSTALRGRVDPDDILQSVWGSFFSRPFDVQDRESLQALLIQMCLNKTRSAARTHTAARRSVVREQHAEIATLGTARPTRAMSVASRIDDGCDRSDPVDSGTPPDPSSITHRPTLELLAAGATPEHAAVAMELVQSLPEELRQILCWRLENLTESEIATRLGCTRRTVTRRLGLIRDHFRAAAAGDDGLAASTGHAGPT